jgi:putative oxidoreductase
MSTTSLTRKAAALDYAAVLARWLVGAVFIYMGLNKVRDPEYFLKMVHAYKMVGTPFLLNSIGAVLPWFEVFCGLLLVAGVAVRGSALMLVLMLVPFTALVTKRALAIAAAQHQSFWHVKFDCGCGNGEVIIWQKIIENSVLFLLACWLLAGYGRRLSARFGLFSDPLSQRQKSPF